MTAGMWMLTQLLLRLQRTLLHPVAADGARRGQATLFQGDEETRRSEIVVEKHVGPRGQDFHQVQHGLAAGTNAHFSLSEHQVVSKDVEGMDVSRLARQCPNLNNINNKNTPKGLKYDTRKTKT
jgi:hypothetical protein